MSVAQPRLRFAALCARIRFDVDGAPFAIERPLHTIRFDPVGQAREFWLYAEIQNAFNVTLALQVQVRDEHGAVVFTSPVHTEVFPNLANRTFPRELAISFRFAPPQAGVYFVHLLCDGGSLNERQTNEWAFPPAQLNVLGVPQ
jgi:hypothetical protein